MIAIIKVGKKANKYLFLKLINISPSGANILIAVKAPSTAGPTKESHLEKNLGNSNRDSRAIGRIRGNKVAKDTPIIIIHILLLVT